MVFNIEKKAKEICQNKKNANIVQEMVSSVEEENCEDFTSTLSVLEKVFFFYAKEGDWKNIKESSTDSNKTVNTWLYSLFQAFIKVLIKKLKDGDESSQVLSLNTLMKCMAIEYLVILQQKSSKKKSEDEEKFNFPNHVFTEITKIVISSSSSKSMLSKFNDFLVFDDIRLYTLKNIYVILQKIADTDCLKKDISTINICQILLVAANFELKPEELNLYLSDIAEEYSVITSTTFKTYKQCFSNAWLTFIRYPNLSNTIQKKILIDLDTKVMPYLIDPKLLIDFLTDSYNIGGVNSLLALNGLFVLINQFNLDYPDFYTKLYDLLSPAIFHVKYKSRFFHLLDMFLSSTHLPAYLVAAFTKKLSRMLVFTPVADMELVLVFIRNLLIRHPSSQILIHRKNSNTNDMNEDPYNYDEKDPSKCNAIKSCLWELATLKSHYSSNILKQLALFKKEIPKIEVDVSKYFDVEFDDLFLQKIMMKKDLEIPVNFKAEQDVFVGLDTSMWVLE